MFKMKISTQIGNHKQRKNVGTDRGPLFEKWV